MRLLYLWIVLLCPALVSAADLAKIDRIIKKEPAYQSKPHYCLLVFGPEAKTRVWLVLDGDTLYVDRNGNGDLTEAGERVRLAKRDQDPAPFEETTITTPEGQHQFQVHLFGWFNLKDGREGRVEPSLSVSWLGQQRYGAWGDEQSPLVFAPRPQEAPVVHVGGPLQMGFEVRSPLRKQGDQVYELSAGVGSKGLGQGSFAHLQYNVIPKDDHPVAVLEFPTKAGGGPTARAEMVLDQRC
jgi:hypothetical protein